MTREAREKNCGDFCFYFASAKTLAVKFHNALGCKDKDMVAATGYLLSTSFIDGNFSKLLGRMWSKPESVFSLSMLVLFPAYL